MAKLLQERVIILNEIKQLLNLAFVEYEGFCRSRRVLSTPALYGIYIGMCSPKG